MKEDKMYSIYTDGSSNYNTAMPDGNGGCAFLVLNPNKDEVYSEKKKIKGTVSECELTAVLLGLRWAVNNNINMVTVYSDSMYFVKSFNEWIYGWSKNNWKTQTKQDVKHSHIMKEFFELKRKFTYCEAVHAKGHNGNIYNEKVDAMAGEARLS